MSDTKSEAKVAGLKPIKENLEPGEYYWCACGLSGNQPYCDGSHVGTDISPTTFKIEEQEDVFLCLCKQTQTPPFCDGTHAKLPKETEVYRPKQSDNEPPQAANTAEEPTVEFIHTLAREGLTNFGHHDLWLPWEFPGRTCPIGTTFSLLLLSSLPNQC